MLTVIRFFLLVVLSVTFSACTWLGIGGDDGWLRDREGEYLQAPVVARMEIPAELDTFTIDDLYMIPPPPAGDREFFVRPPPPKPIDSRIRDGVVVQQFGDRAWIVVGATGGQIWPRLRDYWPTEGIALSREEPVAGVMETVWLPADDGSRHKYRVFIEPGLHAGNSEIYVRHVSDQGESADNEPVRWPDVSDSRERENLMLASISLYLADRADLYRASSVSLLAGSIEADSKARLLDQRAGDTRLELRIDFDRAWSQVSQSLGNANIETVGSDRESRWFDVRFSGEESADRPGFFSRLFRRGGQDEELLRDFRVELVELNGRIEVRAATTDGSTAPRLQDLLIRTINDNLI